MFLAGFRPKLGPGTCPKARLEKRYINQRQLALEIDSKATRGPRASAERSVELDSGGVDVDRQDEWDMRQEKGWMLTGLQGGGWRITAKEGGRVCPGWC